ncbi:AvrE-family type 3 secretion system effector [Pseudomonas alliivorans]|uniref:AvrE n=3 Tax=Pseudomonas viridiflava TaxID=33069 RepID=Q24LB6_PSEVI|nr:AvrE [Pseudomonas viridiflava]AAX58370.1 AvrE [Pseudomonas viridiflava]MEE5114311.1 AvrE-family type 3 secretion system effector [Pseudomonas alliivorans]
MLPINNAPVTGQVHGATSQGHNPHGLEQRPEPPTQRASVSVVQLGKQPVQVPVTQHLDTPPRTLGSTPGASTSAAAPEQVAPTLDADDIAHVSSARRQPGTRSSSTASERPTTALQRELSFKDWLPGQENTPARADHQSSPPQSGGSTPAPIQGRASTGTQDASPKSQLTRSAAGNAGTFRMENGNLERNTPAINLISLDAKGRPDFNHFIPSALGNLLKDRLAQPGRSYLAKNSESNRDQVLLEPKGHLVQIAQTDTALALLRSSKPLSVPPGSKPNSLVLQREDHSVNIAGRDSGVQSLPDKAHIAHLSGAHLDSSGKHLRLQDEKLYELHPATATWSPSEDSKETTFSHLATQGDGKVYGRTGDTLVNLSSTEKNKPEMKLEGLTAHSVSPDGTVAMLAGKDTQTLQLGEMGKVPDMHLTLELNDGKSEAKHIGLTRDRLFVADAEGQLYSVARKDLKSEDGILHLQPEKHYQPEDSALGKRQQVTGFLSGENGQLHALIKNDIGDTHSHTLDEANSSLRSGWNMTDVVVVENRRGLPEGKVPTPESTFDLDRNGRVGVVDNRVQKWDATTEGWKDTGVKGIDQLQRGANSSAYVLKDGKISELKVSPEYTKTSLSGTHNLNQPTRSTKVEMGDAIEGLDDRVIKAFAMLNDKQFAAVDDQGRLTAHHKTGEPTELSRKDLSGEVASLTLDENHNLHATTTAGELYFMAKDDWQAPESAPKPDAKWQKIDTPGNRPVDSIRKEDNNTVSVKLKDGAPDEGSFALKDKKFQPMEPRKEPENGLNNLFGRLDDGSKNVKIFGTGNTLKISSTLAGRSDTSLSHKSSVREFIPAHIVKPDLSIPRPIMNGFYHIQHRIKGREGLQEVYQAEAPVFKELTEIKNSSSPAPQPGQTLKERISRLDLGPEGKQLVEDMEKLRDDLENHSHGVVQQLGQKTGVLNLHGEFIKPERKPTEAQIAKAAHAKPVKNDLAADVQGALSKVAPSSENPAGVLLKRLNDNGMKLKHLDGDTSPDHRRSQSDKLALSKARLALDVVTLDKVGKLIDKAETRNPDVDNATHVKALKTELNAINKQYNDNPVKVVTEMGFSGHKQLEDGYDSIKSFLNGFKDPTHATSVNMRAAMGATSQADLADKMKSALKHLEHPDDEIAMSRSYGVTATTPFISLANMGAGPWPSASLGVARNYAFNAERGDKGVTVYMFHEGGVSGSAGLGGGQRLVPNFGEYNINDQRGFVALRLGGDGTLQGTGMSRSGTAFTVPDEKIDQFVDDLFGGKVNALDVLKNGTAHEAHSMKRFNADATGGVGVELRVELGLSDPNEKEWTAGARAGIGANINLNLATFTKYSATQENDKGLLDEKSNNRVRLANSAGVTAYARAQINLGHTDQTAAAQPATTTQPSAAAPTPAAVAQPGAQASAFGPNATVTASIDSRTTKRTKFQTKEGVAMTTAELTKLSKQLDGAFKDKPTQKELTRLADAKQPEYADKTPKEKIQAHLDGLNTLFKDRPSNNSAQKAALLALSRATTKHDSAIDKHSVLDNARHESNYTNLSRLDEQSVASKIMSMLGSLHSPSNAENIAQLIAEEPNLKSLIGQMKASPGTMARVRLEPKDEMMQKVDQGTRDGSITQKEIIGMLNDRDNLRIKAITVFKLAGQSDGFTTPTPLLSASSSAAVNVNKTLAKINFNYGEDQNRPSSFSVDGEMSRPTKEVIATAQALKKDGMEFRA